MSLKLSSRNCIDNRFTEYLKIGNIYRWNEIIIFKAVGIKGVETAVSSKIQLALPCFEKSLLIKLVTLRSIFPGIIPYTQNIGIQPGQTIVCGNPDIAFIILSDCLDPVTGQNISYIISFKYSSILTALK